MENELNDQDIAGGSPSSGGPKSKTKQQDDSLKGSKKLMKESTKKSEMGNMTEKNGYNETPVTVPVKSVKQE